MTAPRPPLPSWLARIRDRAPTIHPSMPGLLIPLMPHERDLLLAVIEAQHEALVEAAAVFGCHSLVDRARRLWEGFPPDNPVAKEK